MADLARIDELSKQVVSVAAQIFKRNEVSSVDSADASLWAPTEAADYLAHSMTPPTPGRVHPLFERGEKKFALHLKALDADLDSGASTSYLTVLLRLLAAESADATDRLQDHPNWTITVSETLDSASDADRDKFKELTERIARKLTPNGADTAERARAAEVRPGQA